MAAMQIRRLRLGAAFVLLTYLILHFSNHALGLYSLDAMEAGRRWFLMIWRSQLGTLALYGAIVVHGGLGLWLLYQRRTLRMPGWEAAQYALGLAVPARPRRSAASGAASSTPTSSRWGPCSRRGVSAHSGSGAARSASSTRPDASSRCRSASACSRRVASPASPTPRSAAAVAAAPP